MAVYFVPQKKLNLPFFGIILVAGILLYHERSQTAGYNHYSKFDFAEATYLHMKT